LNFLEIHSSSTRPKNWVYLSFCLRCHAFTIKYL